MRRIEYKRSFDRMYKRLSSAQQTKVAQAVSDFLTALENHQIPQGLGLKQLRGDQWEIRVGLDLRICFRMKKELIEFVVVGTHATIRNFLKNV